MATVGSIEFKIAEKVKAKLGITADNYKNGIMENMKKNFEKAGIHVLSQDEFEKNKDVSGKVVVIEESPKMVVEEIEIHNLLLSKIVFGQSTRPKFPQTYTLYPWK